MRQRADIVVWAVALAMIAGCAPFRRARESEASPTQLTERRELSEQAQIAIDHKDLPQARVLLERLVSDNTRSAEAHMKMGRVLQLQGWLDGAADEYAKALVLDPDYVDALIGSGEILSQLGRHTEALKKFDQAIEIDPRKAAAHFAEGQCFEALGETSKALAAYFRALEVDGTSPETILRVAAIQLGRKQPDQALARLDQVLELAPDLAEAHHQRGLVYLALNRPLEAVTDLQAASTKLADRAEVFFHLAQAQEAAKNKTAALDAARTALRLKPGYAEASALSDRLLR